MDRGEQTQQVHPVELGRRIGPASAAGAMVGPAVVDELIGNERSQQFEQFGRAGRRKMGIHLIGICFSRLEAKPERSGSLPQEKRPFEAILGGFPAERVSEAAQGGNPAPRTLGKRWWRPEF